MGDKNLVEILKDFREIKGFSQTQMADSIKVSRSAYNHYETGQRTPPFNVLVKVSRICNTNPMNFLSRLLPEEEIKAYELSVASKYIALDGSKSELIKKLSILNESQLHIIENIVNEFTR